MKTIEERAKEHADTRVTAYNDPMYDAWRQTIMNDYLAGAKDQKQIDIEKACEWLKNNYQNLDYINYEGDLFDLSLVKDFRKAMEE